MGPVSRNGVRFCSQISKELLFSGAALFALGCAGGRDGGAPVSVQSNQANITDSASRNLNNPAASDEGMIPLFIRTNPSVTSAQAMSLFSGLGCNVVQQIPSAEGILWALDAPKKKGDEAYWLELMQKQSGVQTAEIDLTRKLSIPTQ